MTKAEIKKLDKAWKESIHERDNETCQKCGKQGQTNAHHIFGRRIRRLRWDTCNGILLCCGCHTLSSEFSAHQTPSHFTHWFEAKYPTVAEYLEDNVQEIFKGTYEQGIELLENSLQTYNKSV